MEKNNIRHIPNKKEICAHIFNVRALDAKQKINFFWPKCDFYQPNFVWANVCIVWSYVFLTDIRYASIVSFHIIQ